MYCLQVCITSTWLLVEWLVTFDNGSMYHGITVRILNGWRFVAWRFVCIFLSCHVSIDAYLSCVRSVAQLRLVQNMVDDMPHTTAHSNDVYDEHCSKHCFKWPALAFHVLLWASMIWHLSFCFFLKYSMDHNRLPVPAAGMTTSHGTKVRLTFKEDMQQLWLATAERTQKGERRVITVNWAQLLGC